MNWQKVKLGEAYWFQEGPGVRNWQFTSSGIKLFNISNILKSGELDLAKTDKHLSVEEATGKYAHFLADVGDLVMASSGVTWGKTAFIGAEHLPLCLNTSTIRFKAKEGVSNLQYLRHWIHSNGFRRQMTQLVTGSAQPNFGPSHLKLVEIPLPPFDEQQRIANRLDAADRLRAQRRDAVAALDALTHSLFLEMFGDPAHNPMNWPMVKIENIVTQKPNNGIFRKNADYGEGLPVAWVGELFKGNSIDLAESRQLTPTAAELAKFSLKKGDVLFCRSSLKLDGIGYNNVYLGEDGKALFECHVIRISPNQSQINSQFLNSLLRMPSQREKLFRQAKTVTMTTIDQQGILRIEIPLPPLSLQQEFAERLGQIETVRARMERSALELDALFASLQSAAFENVL